MRILVTGFTKLQIAGVKKPQIQKIDVPRQIVETLVAEGHDVDWRRSEFRIGDADLVWVNVAPCLSLNASFALEGLYAIGAAHRAGLPLVLFFDDWQVRGTRSHAGSFPRLQAAKDQLAKVIGGSHLYASDLVKAREVLDLILEGARVLNEGSVGIRVAVPMYAYGRPGLLGETVFKGYKCDGFHVLDPTPFIELISPHLISLDPSRQHTLAALMPHKEWVEERLKPTWPVVYIGSRKLGAYRAKTELEVQAITGSNYGVLSPPYPQAGTGWWRSRYLYAAHLHRILISDLKDALLLGGPYAEATRIRDVESYSRGSLMELANAQSRHFFGRVGSKELWRRTLNTLVTS